MTDDLTEAGRETLAALADEIIPPSARHGVPGAGDPAIVAEIEADARRRMPHLTAALQALDALAEAQAGVRFADLDAATRTATAAAYREAHPGDANLVAALAAQCYYRDGRVMASIGMAERPPHPTGYEVADGDWSLLDPVRRRESFYRATER